MDVAGKVAIVTGGAGGIGKAMGDILLQRQAKNGVIIGTKLAVENMDDNGVIINTSSSAALLLTPCCPVYPTSKYAVLGFTRQIASFDPVVQRKKIRVNGLCPPITDTNMACPGADGRTTEDQYQEVMNEWFENAKPHLSPEVLAKHFIKLIEEPHHGQILSISKDGQQSEFIQDHTKTFREEKGVNEKYNNIIKTAGNKLNI